MKVVVFLALALILVGCSSEEDSAAYTKISAEDAKTLMDDGAFVLDVRTKEEYDGGHVPGAALLPLDQIQAGNYEGLPEKDELILVYCRSGNRSATASKALVEAGYTNIKDFGGIIDWPYATEN